jgi:hypothetical protein
MERAKKVMRIAFYSFFGFALMAAVSTSKVFAVTKWSVPQVFDPSSGINSLQDVVSLIIHIAFLAAGLVAVVYLIIGGFRYVTAAGNPDQVELAKATILNSVIGLIVILISFLIVSYILKALHINSIFGITEQDTSNF